MTDQVLRVVSLAGMSTPSFWLALVALYVFFFQLRSGPGQRSSGCRGAPAPHPAHRPVHRRLAGRRAMRHLRQRLQHLILPACVLAAFNMGLFTRFTRSAVLEVLENNYWRTARGEGLPELRSCSATPPSGVSTVLTVVGARLRQRHDWNSPSREHLFLARNRPVSLSPERDYARTCPRSSGVMLFVAIVYTLVNCWSTSCTASSTRGCGCMSVAAAAAIHSTVRGAGSVARGTTPGHRRVGLAPAGLMIAVLAPLVAPHDPLAQGAALYQTVRGAPLGTDELGRDVFSACSGAPGLDPPGPCCWSALAFHDRRHSGRPRRLSRRLGRRTRDASG